MPRIPARTIRALTTLTAALAGALTLTAASLPGPHYSGTGWKAITSHNIYSLSPDPYEIVFASTTARSKLAGYFTAPAAQVTTQVGVRITVTQTLDTTPLGTCPPRHRIIVHYLHQPLGQRGMSQARPCYATANNSAWGGHILMDSEYWTIPNWFSTTPAVNEARRKDATAHELGHILGLDHPNTDLDRDGTVEAGECVKNKAGLRPLLCSPNRSNPPTSEGGKFTADFDIPGLRQMLANFTLRKNYVLRG
ncbi:hypothetical protein DMH12_24915 [Streptomyces sp. WAC 04229]|uniref:hypothetical protein n=1 Tax=Streptomyces sp. WAC 04229 TaxID=2203206 RepID=UPI000F74A84F|nr:hypothetical protein [Streptomyces sp. WAC 04229]RSN50527.1 hypothetical protein DMH12_24915 [Streptomyces sp. WAC 04229]